MEAHPCLMRFLTNLARLCASKSANGPRKNSFLPDSPLTTTSNRGRNTQPVPLPTPDIARSGRVLQTSVKSPIHSTSQLRHPPALSSNIPYPLHSVCSR